MPPLPPDPLDGLTLPPGDPAPLRSASARLVQAATTATSGAVQQHSVAAGTIGSSWIGDAAAKVAQIVGGLVFSAQTFAAGADAASSALVSAASGWEEAKHLWAQAQALAAAAVAEEEAHRNQAATAAKTAAANGQVATGVADGIVALGLDGFVSPDRARARALGVEAIDLFDRATNTAVAKLANLPGPPGAAAVLEDLKIDAAISDVADPRVFANIRTQLQGMLRDPKSISAGDLQNLEQALGALSPNQRGQLVDDLAHNEVMVHLGQALGDEHPLSTWDQLFGGGDAPLDPTDLLRLYSLLLSNASSSVVASLAGRLPGVDPSLSGVAQWSQDGANDTYLPIPGSVLDGGKTNPNDVSQGGIGDCYFLASLISVAQADPSFVADHLHDNGNGTTTVTLYQDGKAVQITVTNTVPSSTNPNYDGGGPDGATSQGGAWPEIYEKAYAQLRGGYGTIDQGGWGHDGLQAVTGAPTTTVGTSTTATSWIPLVGGSPDPPSVDLNQIQSLLNSHHAVVIGTNANSGNTNDVIDSDQGGKLIENHEYVVQSVHANGTVTLRNPWDPTDRPTLEWSKVEAQSNEVVWTNTAP